MKKRYLYPEVEVLQFEEDDIITTSVQDNDDGREDFGSGGFGDWENDIP